MKIINLLGFLTVCIFLSAACAKNQDVSQDSLKEINISRNLQKTNSDQNSQPSQTLQNSDVNNSAQAEQDVVITSKKVVYKRPKAEMESKKTFEIDYPQVKAATPALSKKIEAILDYEKAFPYLNLREQTSNEDNSLSGAYYEINYNKSNILDITLLYDAVTAYPSTFRKNLIINTKTGMRIRPADVFVNLTQLAEKARKSQLEEIEKTKEEYKKDSENDGFTGNEYFNNAKFNEVELNNFSVSDEGITFNYNYEFPHVVLALQPDGKYFYNWAELKSFIKRDGLLGQFIR